MSSAQAADGLVRLDRWLAGVPRGLDSYPEVRAKGALLRNVLEGQPLSELVGRLPAPLRVHVEEPPLAGDWVPEAHLAGLILSIADLRRLTDGELRAWIRERNRALFRSPAYKILMAVVSPGAMLRSAARRWEYWHRGTSLEVEGVADDGVRAVLRFPPGLFDGTMLCVFAGAFAAALEVARAADPEVTVVSEGLDRATFLARW